jgi:hypothetical protein
VSSLLVGLTGEFVFWRQSVRDYRDRGAGFVVPRWTG